MFNPGLVTGCLSQDYSYVYGRTNKIVGPLAVYAQQETIFLASEEDNPDLFNSSNDTFYETKSDDGENNDSNNASHRKWKETITVIATLPDGTKEQQTGRITHQFTGLIIIETGSNDD